MKIVHFFCVDKGFHPFSNFRVIEQLGGKQLVMNHMHHEDQLVRYNALLAVQKLMVHNWYEHIYSLIDAINFKLAYNQLTG